MTGMHLLGRAKALSACHCTFIYSLYSQLSLRGMHSAFILSQYLRMPVGCSMGARLDRHSGEAAKWCVLLRFSANCIPSPDS